MSNIGANVVSPANDFSNLWPRKIQLPYWRGDHLPEWALFLCHGKLLADYNTFILGWLGGYAAFLGPVAGINDLRYFVVRKCVLH